MMFHFMVIHSRNIIHVPDKLVAFLPLLCKFGTHVYCTNCIDPWGMSIINCTVLCSTWIIIKNCNFFPDHDI